MLFPWKRRNRESPVPMEYRTSLETLETAVKVCAGSSGPDKCAQCPMKGIGCADKIGLELQDQIRHLPDFDENEEAKAMDNDLALCFSDGLPQRCWDCRFDFHKDKGCWQALYKAAIDVIKGGNAK